jgi:Transglutaminase-like superfamily.
LNQIKNLLISIFICTTAKPTMKSLTATLFLFFIVFHSFSQDKKPYKFSKIEAADFKTTVYSIDSNASAVVIADVGSTEIIGNRKGWFSLEFKRRKRIHILNKNGYDYANIEIPLYKDGEDEEELANVKAYTYNLENGKVVETKLEKSQVFKDKISKKWMVKKFTFPAIKEGSIIEYEYTIVSDFITHLQPWEFQDEIPALWSEYTVSIPQFLDYVFIAQGYQQFYLRDKKDKNDNFVVTNSGGTSADERYNFNAGVTSHRFVMKDVPALRTESFTSTIKNHISKVDFQLSALRYPLTPRPVMGSWTQLTQDLLKADYFGADLNKDKGWMGDLVKDAIGGATSEKEKANKIFHFVKNNYTCTSYNSIYLNEPLKNILKTKSGNVAEINLLLVALLNYADIKTDPVLLSTRSHGYANAMYPLTDKFNYVIARATIGDKPYLLDATHPLLGFGKLTDECYNGHARVVNAEATPLDLLADSLKERKVTSVFIIDDQKGNFEGRMVQSVGSNESYDFRNRIKEKGVEEFFKDIRKAYSFDIKIKNEHIDSLQKLDVGLGINYEFNFSHEDEDLLYFNPMMGEAYKENYFKSAERKYPVEMPFAFDETYILQLEVPKGYAVDELPKSIRVSLNEKREGFFEYLVSNSNGQIALRSRIKLDRTYFMPEEYEMLREFFNLIVKKHSEQIVFKKIKTNP